MNSFTKLFSIITIATVALTGCARDMSSDVYTSGSNSGKVLEGTVVSARQITIKESDKLENNAMGMLGGGALGAIAGSSVGKGTGKGLAAVGAGILGAAAGAFAQDKLGTSQGMEYIVRIDKKYISEIPARTTRKEVSYGANTAEKDVSKSIQVSDTKTDLISVVQGRDVAFQPGQHVLIIYSNDRPRIAPAY